MEGQIVIPEYTVAERFADVVASADTVADMVSVCFSAIVSNPFLCVMVAASLIGVGICKFVQLRRAAR